MAKLRRETIAKLGQGHRRGHIGRYLTQGKAFNRLNGPEDLV